MNGKILNENLDKENSIQLKEIDANQNYKQM